MEIKLEKTNNVCELKVNVTVDETEWNNEQTKAVNELAKNVTVKGFRKGHAPLAQAAKSIPQVEVLNKAADALINVAYREMIEKHDVKPFLQPELVVNEFSAKKLDFSFIVATAPEVELGEYKNLTIEKKAVKVLKADVDKELESLVNKSAELVVANDDALAENGNTLVIDFVGYVDGKEFDGGKANNFELTLGSNTFVPGFEDQLVGTKKGETKDVLIKFPENYVAELANKDATFKVTVNEIKVKVLPELNDDFAKECDIKDVNTLEELKAHLKNQLKERKTKEVENKQVDDLLNTIINNAKLSINTKLIDEDAKNILNNFKKRIESQGLNMDDYYKMTNTNEQQLLEQAKVEANKNAKHIFVLDKIAQTEGISVTNDEVQNKLDEIAKMYNMKKEDIIKNLGDRLNEVSANIRNEKVINFLKENNNL